MSLSQAEAAELHVAEPSGLWGDAFDRFKRNPAALAGSLLILAFILVAVFAPAIATHDPLKQVGQLSAIPEGPGDGHIMGLDKQGRDYFSRVVFGTRLSLLVGLVSVSVGLTLGVLLGALAGYLGGWVDVVIMRFMDIMLSIPGLLLAIGIVSALGPGLVQIMIAVGIVNVPIFARLLRAAILGQLDSDYVLAGRSVGVGGWRLLVRHILPNSIAPVIVQATLAMATAIIDVAGLSFLGLGPSDPSFPEWGKMLADSASRLEQGAHLVFFPGMAIVLSVLGLNLVGDGLREAIDPRLKT